MNQIQSIEFDSVDAVVNLAKAGRSQPLTAYAITELFEAKLISKVTYAILAISHDYGVMEDPGLNQVETEKFAERWELNPGDIRKAMDKIITAICKGEEQDERFPQLTLFPPDEN